MIIFDSKVGRESERGFGFVEKFGNDDSSGNYLSFTPSVYI